MKNPAISIVIPCYNQGCFLQEVAASVKAQALQDWECILVNDGSTDDTESIAKDLCTTDKRFVYAKKDNGGVSSARNHGIRMARGTYILPLDADDLIHPQYTEKAVGVFRAKPQVKLVYCKARFFGDLEQDWDLRAFNYRELLFGNNMIFSAAVFRKKDFEKTGGYYENMDKGWEDWDFNIRFLQDAEKESVVRLNEVLFYYRVKGNSRSVHINGCEGSQLEMVNRSVQNNIAIYTDHFPNLPQQLRSREYFGELFNKRVVRLAVKMQLGWERMVKRMK